MIADRYELDEIIGCGGSATVYRAWDRRLERVVAVKRYAAGVTGPDRSRRAVELRALAQLDHPGLVSLYDAGTADDRPYLVMQLVDGPSLTDRLAGATLGVAESVAMGRHLVSSLRYVHVHGITHRDVKPANVLLDRAGRPLLTDFGIALLVDTARVTTGDVVVGTAAYMAPEQVRGEPVGPPADVYALGLVLLESITGERAYPGTEPESAVARLHHPPTVPTDLVGGYGTVLRRMTAPDPRHRPDARALVGELATVADRIEAAIAPTPRRVAPAAVPARRSPRGLLALSGAAALAIVGGVLGGVASAHTDARLAEVPAPMATAPQGAGSASPAGPSAPVRVAVDPPVVPSRPGRAEPPASEPSTRTEDRTSAGPSGSSDPGSGAGEGSAPDPDDAGASASSAVTDDETPDGEAADGEAADGQAADGEAPDGQAADGQTPDGQAPDGQTPDDDHGRSADRSDEDGSGDPRGAAAREDPSAKDHAPVADRDRSGHDGSTADHGGSTEARGRQESGHDSDDHRADEGSDDHVDHRSGPGRDT